MPIFPTKHVKSCTFQKNTLKTALFYPKITLKKIHKMNIYEMYYENNKKFNFWIQRDTWGKTIAQVKSIEDTIEGNNIPGRKPYHKNQKVEATFYTKCENTEAFHKNNISPISSPGTYSYYMIKVDLKENGDAFKIYKPQFNK
jgi:hypothetical protein